MQLIGKILHGEQDFRFHRPIRPGDVLIVEEPDDRLAGPAQRHGGLRAHRVPRPRPGELVNEQFVTFFVRGFDTGDSVGELAPGHRFDEALRADGAVAEVKQHVDDDQTYRYGPAAGDPMPIHLDDEFAKEMGLPGIIAHGLCTMAFTSWALLTEVGGSDVARLSGWRSGSPSRSCPVRTSPPASTGRRAGSTGGVTTYAFETAVDGDLVIKDGLAEISSSTTRKGELTWDSSTDASPSSPARVAASGASTRCSSPARARRSSSTTSAAATTAAVRTWARPRRSSTRSGALGGEAVANTDNVATWAGAKALVDQAVAEFGAAGHPGQQRRHPARRLHRQPRGVPVGQRHRRPPEGALRAAALRRGVLEGQVEGRRAGRRARSSTPPPHPAPRCRTPARPTTARPRPASPR